MGLTASHSRGHADQACPANNALLDCGSHPRILVLSKPVAWVMGVAFVICIGWATAATWVAFFRDDFVSNLISRQTQMQYAYESRLGALRAQVDRITSRQLLEQDGFEGRVTELLERQSQLETRQAVIAALANQTGLASAATGAKVRAASTEQPTSPSEPDITGAIAPRPVEASSIVPLQRKPAPLDKPRPDHEAMLTPDASPARPTIVQADGTLEERLRSADRSIAAVETSQIQALHVMARETERSLGRLQKVVAEVGVRPESDANEATGGPYVPVNLEESGPFASQVDRIQSAMRQKQKLKRFVSELPLGKPFPFAADITSSFGTRSDPFTHGFAMHTGLDFRADYGTPARATGPGKVIEAGYAGGYGNMVEIDHGNGVTTRYGHLSSILVEEGQTVKAGDVIGRVGSTGRSTGPHLHYETRIGGDAVNPTRFLSVGERLTATAD